MRICGKRWSGSFAPARCRHPGGRGRDRVTSDALASALEIALDRAGAAHPNPGRPAAFHRLNRTEYTNAIRDLLGLEIDGEALLPVDDTGYGFDNIADVLSVSPGLLDRWMSAAAKIARLAVGNLMTPQVTEYKQTIHLRQDARMGEDLPFGSRGGIAIRHYFPRDGEYVLRIKLQRDEDGNVRGLNHRQPLDVRINDMRIARFTIGENFKDGEERVSYSDYSTYEMHGDDGLEVRFRGESWTGSGGDHVCQENLGNACQGRAGTLAHAELYLQLICPAICS